MIIDGKLGATSTVKIKCKRGKENVKNALFLFIALLLFCGGLIPAASAREDSATLTPTAQGLFGDLKDTGCNPFWLHAVREENGVTVNDLRSLWKGITYHPAQCKQEPPAEVLAASKDDLYKDRLNAARRNGAAAGESAKTETPMHGSAGTRMGESPNEQSAKPAAATAAFIGQTNNGETTNLSGKGAKAENPNLKLAPAQLPMVAAEGMPTYLGGLIDAETQHMMDGQVLRSFSILDADTIGRLERKIRMMQVILPSVVAVVFLLLTFWGFRRWGQEEKWYRGRIQRLEGEMSDLQRENLQLLGRPTESSSRIERLEAMNQSLMRANAELAEARDEISNQVRVAVCFDEVLHVPFIDGKMHTFGFLNCFKKGNGEWVGLYACACYDERKDNALRIVQGTDPALKCVKHLGRCPGSTVNVIQGPATEDATSPEAETLAVVAS